MELTEQDISQIDDFLEGKLTGSELEAFNARMKAEPEFAEAVELQRGIVRAVETQGRADMAVMLAGVHAEMINHPSLKPYKPVKKGSKGGSRFGRFLLKLLILTGILLGGYFLAKKMGWWGEITEDAAGMIDMKTPWNIDQHGNTRTETADTVYYINGKKSDTPPEFPEGTEVEIKEKKTTTQTQVTGNQPPQEPFPEEMPNP